MFMFLSEHADVIQRILNVLVFFTIAILSTHAFITMTKYDNHKKVRLSLFDVDNTKALVLDENTVKTLKNDDLVTMFESIAIKIAHKNVEPGMTYVRGELLNRLNRE